MISVALYSHRSGRRSNVSLLLSSLRFLCSGSDGSLKKEEARPKEKENHIYIRTAIPMPPEGSEKQKNHSLNNIPHMNAKREQKQLRKKEKENHKLPPSLCPDVLANNLGEHAGKHQFPRTVL